MKKELSPAVFWAVIGLVALVAVVIGYKVLGPKGFNPDRTGSEPLMKKVQEGGKLYEPPANAPIPGNPGYRMDNGPNLGGSSGGAPVMGMPPGGPPRTGN